MLLTYSPTATSEEWELGFRFSLPIGFREQLSTVRHHQLLLARDRALLQDLELEVSHQLGDALRDLDLQYGLTETNFNRRTAAQREVEAVQAQYDANRVTLDLLLDAQRRRSEADTAYYRALVDYNLAVVGCSLPERFVTRLQRRPTGRRPMAWQGTLRCHSPCTAA